jgi:hypothetical protein
MGAIAGSSVIRKAEGELELVRSVGKLYTDSWT